jgi:hypothetical protein
LAALNVTPDGGVKFAPDVFHVRAELLDCLHACWPLGPHLLDQTIEFLARHRVPTHPIIGTFRKALSD